MQKVLIDDQIHRRVKAQAALDGMTIQDYVTEAIRHELARPPRTPERREEAESNRRAG